MFIPYGLVPASASRTSVPSRERGRAEEFVGEQGKTDGFAASSAVAVHPAQRAFSSGAVVLSGVEAISNGVPAFHNPQSKNAATTLALMATILGVSTLGVGYLASRTSTRCSRRAATPCCPRWVGSVRREEFLYYCLQFATFAILILAANTAYADFPRLSSIIARDGFLPVSWPTAVTGSCSPTGS